MCCNQVCRPKRVHTHAVWALGVYDLERVKAIRSQTKSYTAKCNAPIANIDQTASDLLRAHQQGQSSMIQCPANGTSALSLSLAKPLWPPFVEQIVQAAL